MYRIHCKMIRFTVLVCVVVICIIQEIESFQMHTNINCIENRCTLSKLRSVKWSTLVYDQSIRCSSIRRSRSISSTCCLFNRDDETNNNNLQQQNIETTNNTENLNKFRLLMGRIIIRCSWYIPFYRLFLWTTSIISIGRTTNIL